VNADTSFEKISLLLVAPKTQNNTSLRQTLTDLNFRDFRNGSSVADITNALKTRPPELLITDGDLPDGDVCALISDIRNNRIGNNPFLSIIVTTWQPSENLVRRVIDCGADDLLVQPASRRALRSRIDTLTFNRKPFVVTATYIGPNRRADSDRSDPDVPLIDVPNTFLQKATGVTDPTALQRSVEAAIATVNIDKLVRDASHIKRLADDIHESYQFNRIDGELLETMQSLSATAGDAHLRLQSTRFAPVAKLCQALIAIVGRMEASIAAPDPRDVKLLPQIALSISIALEDIDSSAAAASKISAVVAAALPNEFR